MSDPAGISLKDFEEQESSIGIGGFDSSGGISLFSGAPIGTTTILPPIPSVGEVEGSEEEKAFAIAHPNTYAAREVFFDFLRLARRTAAPTPQELEESFTELGKRIPIVRNIAPMLENLSQEVMKTPSGGEVEGTEEERARAILHPNIYAAEKTARVLAKFGRRTLFPTAPELEESLAELNKHIPFTKYIDPEKREWFKGLESDEKLKALAWDAVDVALLTVPLGKVVGGVGRVVAKGAKVLRPAYKFAPIEDLILKGVRPFVEEQGIFNVLKKEGWKADEVKVFLEAPNELANFLRSKKGDVSQALKESIDWSTGFPRFGSKVMETTRPDILRRTHYLNEWKGAFVKAVKGELGTVEKKELANLARDSFDAQVTKALGEEVAGKITLKNAPDIFMANFARDLHKGSKIVRGVLRQGTYDKIMFDSFSPVRVVFGTWEKLYGAYSKIYKKISPALEVRNEYIAEKHLTLFQMYKNRGLGTWSRKKTGEAVFHRGFSEAQLKEAKDAVLEIDHLTEVGRRIPILKEEMARKAKVIGESISPTAQKLVRTWRDFSDHLFAEHILEKIPQIFEAEGLTSAGRRGVSKMAEQIGPVLSKIFSKEKGLSYTEKSEAIKKLLLKVRELLKHPLVEKEGVHPWFADEGKALLSKLARIEKNLTQGRKGNFVSYLENYAARVGQRANSAKEGWDTALLGRMHPFYEKGRKTIAPLDIVEDFGTMMEVRVRSQANELFLYPKIEEAVSHARTLPAKVREYTDHYVSRILGRTSLADEKVASFLNKTIGKLGGKSYWTEEKVGHLARRLNDLCIMGGLGFKPFALLRNLFQPLLTVPVDLGGVKGFHWLLKGYRRALLDPGFRKYVIDIGAIQEFAPEMYMTQRIFKAGKGARWDQMRDAALWMYGYSDRLNRYVAGGAAFEKWERLLGEVGGIEGLGSSSGLQRFSRKLLKGRYPWMQDEIGGLLRMGRIEEAKATFVKDVIADTQYLYRVSESPIVSQKFGAVGKTGFLFQSWWMNYGTLLEKWMRTGDAGAKANKVFTWMLSGAIGATMMEQAWGTGTALRSTFLGPFPSTFDKTLIPAAWTPIYELIHTVAWGIPQHLWKGEPEKLEENAKSLIRSLAILVPGGLQMKQIFKAVKKEGVAKGLPESIIRYQRTRNWEPMPVRAYKGLRKVLR